MDKCKEETYREVAELTAKLQSQLRYALQELGEQRTSWQESLLRQLCSQ